MGQHEQQVHSWLPHQHDFHQQRMQTHSKIALLTNLKQLKLSTQFTQEQQNRKQNIMDIWSTECRKAKVARAHQRLKPTPSIQPEDENPKINSSSHLSCRIESWNTRAQTVALWNQTQLHVMRNAWISQQYSFSPTSCNPPPTLQINSQSSTSCPTNLYSSTKQKLGTHRSHSILQLFCWISSKVYLWVNKAGAQ